MKFEISGEPRTVGNRGSSRRLRRTGRVPAIVYGGGKAPRAISIDHNSLAHQMVHEAFYTSILSVKVGEEAQSVVVKDVQRHPARPLIMHLDFQRIVEDQEITLRVPIHFLGEEVAKGVKEQGGVVEHIETDVEISCLPRYLPEYLELDVTNLELNQMYHLADIKLPEGVTSIALKHGQNLPVVAVNLPREEEIEAPVEAVAAEVPTVGAEEKAAAEAAAAALEGKPGEEKGKAAAAEEPAKKKAEETKKKGDEPKKKGGKEKD
ncbi:MAG TPA: 50S ribosomal protein L25/general stress protein Ctc [Gammaproteobacteria bacterium]